MSTEILYESIIIKAKEDTYLPLLISGSSNCYEAYNPRKRERVLTFNYFLRNNKKTLYTKDELKQAFKSIQLEKTEEDIYTIRYAEGRGSTEHIRRFLLYSLRYPIDIDKLQGIRHPLIIKFVHQETNNTLRKIIVTSENIERLSPLFSLYCTKDYYINLEIKGIRDEKNYRRYVKQYLYPYTARREIVIGNTYYNCRIGIKF